MKILVVDDEQRMRKLVKDFLTNKGFSVVEAINVICPFSINSNKICCCFLLKYCISSKYNKTPFIVSNVFKFEITSLISEVEAVVPFIFTNLRLVVLAIMVASVVFPTPEGP